MTHDKFYYTILVKTRKFGIEDMPQWLWNFDHGTNLSTGLVDIDVSEKSLSKVKRFFRMRKIPVKIIRRRVSE